MEKNAGSPDKREKSTTVILVALSFSQKNAPQLYIQHEQLVSFAPVDKYDVMNYQNWENGLSMCL